MQWVITMKAECRNKFCIYYENECCILSSVSLDELGCCERMFMIDVEEELLAKKRKKLLEKFEEPGHF